VNTVDTLLNAETIRNSLQDFWSDALQVEPTKDGFALAMPVSLPDGWQIVVELTERTPRGVKLTDSGRTLSWLSHQGQNIETEAIKAQLDEMCKLASIQQDGWELSRWIPLPLQGVDVHVFAETLTSIAHLHFLREVTPRTSEVADITLQRVFADRKLEANRNVPLIGKTEHQVRVDYYVQPRKPVAFQLLRRKGRVMSTMEQWGYRWNDLRKVTPELMPVMLFDPSVQEIDQETRAIGEDVCELFCAYDETERIHEVLARATE
jgi:hypothetical protein